MLTELTIKNLGLIESETIEFSPGLNSISGETGAGKTMLLSAIHLLRGGRSSASKVRTGCQQLSVDSYWQVSDEIKGNLEALGVELDGEDDLAIGRTVKADGKSRATIGGRASSASALGNIASELISIHGQSDQLKLRDPSEQLRILDASDSTSKVAEAFADYSSAYKVWKKAHSTLENVKKSSASAKREIGTLKKFLADLSELDPQPDEIEELEATLNRLGNLEKINSHLVAARDSIWDTEDIVIAGLETAASELSKVSSISSDYEKLHDLSESVLSVLKELEDGIDLELGRSEVDDLGELAEAQGRLIELRALLKRSAVDDLDALEAERVQAEARLEELSVYDRPIEDLEADLEAALEKLKTSADALSKARAKIAESLAAKVNVELSGLAMGNSEFGVIFTPADPTPTGMDQISFSLKQTGQEFKPIQDAASGGELSRIMLALELSLADTKGKKSTYIFDEVDSGIGGATAHEVGKRLAKLGRTNQVIVVSHLGQVCCYADNQLKVVKTDDGTTVTTSVETISDDDRVKEIARLLSGIDDSESALEHSRELLAAAEELKLSWN